MDDLEHRSFTSIAGAGSHEILGKSIPAVVITIAPGISGIVRVEAVRKFVIVRDPIIVRVPGHESSDSDRTREGATPVFVTIINKDINDNRGGAIGQELHSRQGCIHRPDSPGDGPDSSGRIVGRTRGLGEITIPGAEAQGGGHLLGCTRGQD